MTFTSQTQPLKPHHRWPASLGPLLAKSNILQPLSPVMKTEGAVGEIGGAPPTPARHDHTDRTVSLSHMVIGTWSPSCPPPRYVCLPLFSSVPRGLTLARCALLSTVLLRLSTPVWMGLSLEASSHPCPGLTPRAHSSLSIYPRLLPKPFKTSPVPLRAARHIPGPGKTK